jgi:hypothetical protein
MKRLSLAVATFATATIVAACGGGGGGSTTPPTNPATSTPATTAPATATPTPVPTATATPVATLATGRAVSDAGSPLAGATVTLYSGFNTKGGAFTGPVGTATTAADGSFSITPTAAASTVAYIEIDATGAASLHRFALVSPNTTTALGTYTLPVLTADESAGIAAYNAARAQYGSGQGAVPRIADADDMIVARGRVAQMAAGGWFAHTAPGATITASYVLIQAQGASAIPNGMAYGIGDDIGANISSSAALISAFMGEGVGGGHYQDVIAPLGVFVGISFKANGLPYSGETVQAPTNYGSLNWTETLQ